MLIVRVVTAFLILVISLFLLADNSGSQADSNTAQTTEPSSLDSSENVSAGQTPSIESTDDFEATYTAAPTEITTMTNTPSPELTSTLQPTVLLAQTETAAADTPFAPLESTAVPIALPTALPFPTVDLATSIVPSAIPSVIPQNLPVLATLDDGASDWLGSSRWSLQSHDSGLAWVMRNSTGSELLRWQTPLDLRSAMPSIVLTFQSQFVGDGLASVWISTDGSNWQRIAVVPASESWKNVSVDLSIYIGSVIQITFAWQNTNGETPDQWALDTIVVAERMPTMNLWEQLIGPIATLPPIDLPTNIVPTEGSMGQPSIMPIACELDIDADGTVTDSDLRELDQAMLNTHMAETTMIYDYNGNYQIDIGDLQMMANHLFETCSD